MNVRVVGFDIGNESCVVAVARQKRIDVVLTDDSRTKTPSIVCFGDKQRFIGTAGAAVSGSTMINMNMKPRNTISQIKRLLGRKFNDPELQRDIKCLPYVVTEGPDGFPLIHVRYLGEPRTFTPTQVLGMLLSNLKGVAEKKLNAAIVDCCIGIPVYFTDLQRRAVLDAATIAGLYPLRLIHETTAAALAYGYGINYKTTDLPESGQLNVAFVDVGHASMQVCIAGFKKGQLKILAHSFDRSLGGRDFDEVLFHHFAEKFKKVYKIDVYQNTRACLRLRAAVEKMKKILCRNQVATLNIQCLMDDTDVRGFIKREEFEEISAPILERVKRPLEKALAEAGLTVDDVDKVEVVGLASRVPAIIKILSEFFKIEEPTCTMNATECVARGCALQCALLSSSSQPFKVREFQVNESFPFTIALSWKSAASDNQQNTIVFPKGSPIPSEKLLTFYRSSTFSVDLNELQANAKISTYEIGPFQSTESEFAKLKLKARLNQHGIVFVELATVIPLLEGPMMETDTKVELKKKVKKTNIPVTELVYEGMAAADVQKAAEMEFGMALQDLAMEETNDRKKALVAYICDMRIKLISDRYQDFATVSEREDFTAKLDEVEDWLHEEGEDETKRVYIAKLEELKKDNIIEERYTEYVNRGAVIDQFIRCIKSYTDAALSNDNLDIIEKRKVLNKCVEAEAWVRDKKLLQDALPKSACPVLWSSDVLNKTKAVDWFCRPIMMRPKPAPALAPAKPASPKTPPTPPPQANKQQSQVGCVKFYDCSHAGRVVGKFLPSPKR